MDILAKFDEQVQLAPDRIAHVSGTRRMTYGELAQRANHLAAYLAATVDEKHTPVAVIGHKEPEMLVAFLACIKAGHPYVPIDSMLPARRVDGVVSIADPALVLTAEKIAALSTGEAAAPARVVSPEDVLYIMFTSGSTGQPKGVPITIGAVGRFVDWMIENHAPRPGEVFLNQVVFSFDVSVMDTWTSLTTGGTIFSVTRDDIANPQQLFSSLATSEITTWVSTPSFAQLCLAERSFGRSMLPRVERFLFCGEALSADTAAQLLDRFDGVDVWNYYGPTEATVATTALRIDRDIIARHPILPIGRPMPGVDVFVADERLEPIETSRRGELIVVGPNVSPGYLHRRDLTERVFFEREGRPAYRTGDWGHRDNGLLFFEGRMDSQIKLNGYRIELGDIEANLCALPGVQAAVVAPVLKDVRAQSLAAFIVMTGRDASADAESAALLREQLGARLPAYMVPSRLVLLDAFPMTANGKVDRRQLMESL
jgi:D-alanine--poly(phosphoribitol) ligase subunit 1